VFGLDGRKVEDWDLVERGKRAGSSGQRELEGFSCPGPGRLMGGNVSYAGLQGWSGLCSEDRQRAAKGEVEDLDQWWNREWRRRICCQLADDEVGLASRLGP